MSKASRFFVPVVFLAIGLVGGMYLQGPALAQNPARPFQASREFQKWEYRTVLWNFNVDKQQHLEAVLSKLGEDGFEVASETGTPSSIVFVLKRSR